MQSLINFSYVLASVLFIFGIKMLGRADTAKYGNWLSCVGMLVAVAVTLLDRHILSFQAIVVAMLLGGGVAVIMARKVQMMQMPEMIALLNGFGGLASMLVGIAEHRKILIFGWQQYLEMCGSECTGVMALMTTSATFAAIFIGAITFTGSMVAYLKLSGKIKSSPVRINGLFNVALLAFIIGLGVFSMMQYDNASWVVYVMMSLSLLLGVTGVMPIGGGDMPVVISLLNSLSGLAAAATGFILTNVVLIVAGCLVGTSGLILTIIMCKAMNRSLRNVLFGGFGSTTSAQCASGEQLKELSVEDAYYVLEAAKTVVFIPGYGMAVAQAQHVLKELGVVLENNGAEIKYAIHPVAGRMPGHMNVLLAEADVPYDQLADMETANNDIKNADVAVVIGANDVVNTAAIDDKDSPIYGMPIINAHLARTVFVLKRGSGLGFSGLQNGLFTRSNTRMVYGDAKKTISALIAAFKETK